MPIHQIARIIMDYYIFLETTDEELLDPDVAVTMMEGIAYHLDQLDKPFLRELVDACAAISPEYGKAEELVRDFPHAFGLDEVLAADAPAPSADG